MVKHNGTSECTHAILGCGDYARISPAVRQADILCIIGRRLTEQNIRLNDGEVKDTSWASRWSSRTT